MFSSDDNKTLGVYNKKNKHRYIELCRMFFFKLLTLSFKFKLLYSIKSFIYML